MVANMHLIAIQNGTLNVQIDMIADVDVFAVYTVEGRLYDRVLAYVSQQSLKNSMPFGGGVGTIVKLEQTPDLLTVSRQVRIKAVVGFSCQHFLSFAS
jgi:hypothetical protein